MYIIPEISTVLILTPRTGSGSLRRAVAKKYPGAMLLYRHMEADGLPGGYDRWRKLGVVRQPVERLWSLYKFLQRFDGDHDPDYIAAQRKSVARPFEEWLVENQTVFTSPYDSAGLGRFWPQYTVRHPLPENRKSQFLTLRPDLGTEVYRYGEVWRLARDLGLELERHNATESAPVPQLGPTARQHVERVFAWDLGVFGELRA